MPPPISAEGDAMLIASQLLRHVFGLSIFVVVLLAAAQPAVAQAPRDRAALTKAMAEKFRAAMPGAGVEIKKEPLTLGIKPSGGVNQFQVNLDRVWDYCRGNKDQCPAMMEDYVARSTAAIAGTSDDPAAAPLDVSTLRLVVRPASYVQNLRRQFAQAGAPSEPVAGLIAGDLWWVLVSDSPDAVRVVSKSELDDNKLGPRAAMEIGRANLERLMPPLSKVATRPGATGVGLIEGDYYTSSRLLLNADEWNKLAQGFSGRLVAVAPDPRVLLFADHGIKGAREALDRMAEDIASRSDRPLSMALVQWTDDGWGPVAR
jgi:hypothetical protein